MRVPKINLREINIPPPPFLSAIPLASYLHLLVTVSLLVLVVRTPLDWESVILAGIAGSNLAAAFFGFLVARANESVDKMHELLRDVIATNHHNKDVFEAVVQENHELRDEVNRLKQAECSECVKCGCKK